MTPEQAAALGIVAEFQKSAGGRMSLFSLTSESDKGRDFYDVEFSHKLCCHLLHQSGFGGSGPIEVAGIYFADGAVEVRERPCQLVAADDNPPWRSARTRAIRARNRTRRLRRLPNTFMLAAGEDLLHWLRRTGIECEPVYCSVCRDWMPDTEICRHIFWSGRGDWQGAGAGHYDGHDGVRESFQRLVRCMPTAFAVDLRQAIRSGQFCTWSVTPLIGGGGIVTLHGMRHRWPNLLDLEDRADAEQLADGYGWLVSLYKRATRDANALTVAWIDDLLDQARSLGRLADDGGVAAEDALERESKSGKLDVPAIAGEQGE